MVSRMTRKSLVVIFQTLEPRQSQWPLQPQQPRWPQCDLYSLISTTTKKNYWSWWLDPPWCQNDQYWSLLIESKILFFTDISTFSVRGCWRQPMNDTFLKTKNGYQKFIISGFQNYFQTRFYLHILICKRQFIKHSSMWDTLYICLFNAFS